MKSISKLKYPLSQALSFKLTAQGDKRAVFRAQSLACKGEEQAQVISWEAS